MINLRNQLGQKISDEMTEDEFTVEELKAVLEQHSLTQFCEIGIRLFQLRNCQYGDSYTRDGLHGTISILVGTAERLRRLVSNQTPANLMRMAHILVDVHNYALMCLELVELELQKEQP